MAIQLDFPRDTGGVCSKAYLVINCLIDNVGKKGVVELCVWSSKADREKKKKRINIIYIPIREEEAWYEKQILGNDMPDSWPEFMEGEKIYISSVAFNDFAWGSGQSVYKKIKTLSINVGGEIIDLSKSIDVL